MIADEIFNICRFTHCILIKNEILSWKEDLELATKVVSSNLVHGEVYSIQHYVIKFVSDLRLCGCLRVLQFPQPIKLTAMI